MSEATQRRTETALAWYRDNHTSPPFDPDGMCLKICRTARNIASMWPSAVSAQEHTPEQYRVHKVSDVKRGMVVFFDDPHDSNPYGHITTAAGWTPGSDRTNLHDLLVWTNSVVANQIVLVRGDYFIQHWGDLFQFAAPYLNGEPFYDLLEKPAPAPAPKPVPKDRKFPKIEASIESMNEAIDLLNKSIERHRKAGDTRMVHALRRDRVSLREAHANLRDTISANKNKGR